MAGYVAFGETLLKQAKALEAGTAAEAVEDLVARHAVLVFRIAYSILRNHHDAEDAVQECFLRLVKAQWRLAQVRNPKTWLARVAWTTALDRRRKRAVFSGEAASGEETLARIPDAAIAADEQLAGREMQRLLQKLVAGLPDDLRQPLELSTVQELNSAEIAEVMNIPEGSVRTRLLRARKLLKEKLAALEVTENA